MGWMLDQDVVVEGTQIAYRDGGGGGRPVVLVHGTPLHSYIWRQVAPRLSEAGYRVLVFDLSGYGRSERPLHKDTSVAAQSRILEQLLDVWKLDQADVVGHDIGEAATMILAIAKPERFRSLALIDTVSYDSWPSETWQKIIREHLQEHHRMSLEEFRKMMVGQLRMTVHDKERMSGKVLGAYLEPLSGEVGKISFFAHQVNHYDSRYTQETAAELKKLAMPVKILWGEEDQWQPVSYGRRLASDIPRAELSVVPQAGHFLMEDAPHRVTQELLDFLRT